MLENVKRRLWRAMIDRGANGTIAGSLDCRILDYLGPTVDLNGIDDHTVANLKMVTAASKVRTNQGDIIIIMNQAAYMPDGRTILSTGQMEEFGILVNDKPRKVTGHVPFIQLKEGHRIPISIQKGLPYIDLRSPSDEELDTLPKLHLTSPHPYDPHVIDSKVPEDWYTLSDKGLTDLAKDSPFDLHGNLKEEPTPLEDEDDGDMEDRKSKPVTRREIRALFHDLAYDEFSDEFDDFDVYTMDYGEMTDDRLIDCYDTELRRSKRIKNMPKTIPEKQPKKKKRTRPAKPRSRPKGGQVANKRQEGLEYYENPIYGTDDSDEDEGSSSDDKVHYAKS